MEIQLRTIDIHSHFIPESMWKTVDTGSDWFDIKFQEENGVGFTLSHLGKDQVPCLLYTSPSPRDATLSRMPSSA